MRLVIELKKDVIPQVVINQLYRQTDLQTTLRRHQPGHPRRAARRSSNLKETLEAFIAHRRDVVTRRTRYELRQAEAQREIVEGLGVAVTDVDLVVKTIRASRRPRRPRGSRSWRSRSPGLEAFVAPRGPPAEPRSTRRRSSSPYTALGAPGQGDPRDAPLAPHGPRAREARQGVRRAVRRHRAVPRHPREPQAPRRRHRHGARGDPGRSTPTSGARRSSTTTPRSRTRTSSRKRTWSSPSPHAGYIKRTSPKDYRAQKRGGKGRIGMEAREEDWVTQLFVASTHAYVFFFSDKGKVYVKKVYEIPLAARTSKGRAIVNFIGIEPGEKVAAIVVVPKIEKGKFVVTLTQEGPDQEDRARRVRELPREGDHRRQGRRRRPAPLRRADRRHARAAHRDQERAEHPLPRGAGAPDGARDVRREGRSTSARATRSSASR